MSKSIGVGHIRKILPQLPAIASKLGVPEFRYNDISLSPDLTDPVETRVDAHINGYILTFDEGRVIGVRCERWNHSDIPEWLRALAY